MYVKYYDINSYKSIEVRDVRCFCIQTCDYEDENGANITGAAICDKLPQTIEAYGNQLVEYMACFLLDGSEKVFPNCRFRKDVLPIGEDLNRTELAVFESKEIAERVLDEICKALASGKQYFDLTLYGEKGNLL